MGGRFQKGVRSRPNDTPWHGLVHWEPRHHFNGNGTSSSKLAASLTNKTVSAELASLRQSSKRPVRDIAR